MKCEPVIDRDHRHLAGIEGRLLSSSTTTTTPPGLQSSWNCLNFIPVTLHRSTCTSEILRSKVMSGKCFPWSAGNRKISANQNALISINSTVKQLLCFLLFFKMHVELILGFPVLEKNKSSVGWEVRYWHVQLYTHARPQTRTHTRTHTHPHPHTYTPWLVSTGQRSLKYSHLLLFIRAREELWMLCINSYCSLVYPALSGKSKTLEAKRRKKD